MSFEVIEVKDELRVTKVSQSYLLEAVKWSKFIAIVGFIGVGIIVLIGVVFGILLNKTDVYKELGMDALSGVGSAFFIFIYLLIALVYFFPLKFLYDFSVNTKKALEAGDDIILEEAFAKLRSLYKYIGILMIILLSFYVLVFIFAFLGALVGTMV